MRYHFGYQTIMLAIFLSAASLLSTCSPQQTVESVEEHAATKIALDWNKLLLELEWHTPGYRPPVSARMFAYAEMAAYEAALPGMNGYVSLENTCPGFENIHFETTDYHLPSALNAAYAYIARAFFPTAPIEWQEKIKQLEAGNRQLNESNATALAIQYSINFGNKTAAAVWRYAMQDSMGHDGFMYNYDRHYKPRTTRGCWVSSEEHPMPPLLPYWGLVRPFVVNTQEKAVKPPIPFGETAPSAFYSQAMEVFSTVNSLSSEERWIAEFWSDDLPGLTITPIGRWISITNQCMEHSSISFPVVMETYLKTAMALCDAAIVCWDAKYKYQLERPETFIRRNIKPDWRPLHNNPSFPSYPSGHAMFGAAAAEILAAAFGADYSITDRTHQGRQEFMGKPRSFKSFDDMANENAYSRLLIGVHYRMDCEEGLRLGKIVGQKVNALSLHKGQAEAIRLNNATN